jgi:hypothetical protein
MLEQIKEALEEATPGPWEVTDTGNLYITKNYRYENGKHIAHWIAEIDSDDENERQHEDAHLIANTPTYIRYLLDELEKADKEIAKYHKLHDDGYNEMRIMQEEIDRLKGKVDYKSTIIGYSVELIEDLEKGHAAMKEALEWYADDGTYTIPHIGCSAKVMSDKGERARTALSNLSKEEQTNGTVE